MSYWNKDKDKKRTNWNQSLRSLTKTNKPKKLRKSLQYLLLLKKFNNEIDYKMIDSEFVLPKKHSILDLFS